MTSHEIKCYELLCYIQKKCDDSVGLEDIACFRNIYEACDSEMNELHYKIGQRIIKEYLNQKV